MQARQKHQVVSKQTVETTRSTKAQEPTDKSLDESSSTVWSLETVTSVPSTETKSQKHEVSRNLHVCLV